MRHPCYYPMFNLYTVKGAFKEYCLLYGGVREDIPDLYRGTNIIQIAGPHHRIYCKVSWLARAKKTVSLSVCDVISSQLTLRVTCLMWHRKINAKHQTLNNTHSYLFSELIFANTNWSALSSRGVA